MIVSCCRARHRAEDDRDAIGKIADELLVIAGHAVHVPGKTTVRYITIEFTCDGKSCDAKASKSVEIEISEDGQITIDETYLPDNWSRTLESDRYDHRSDRYRRNCTACPKCKMDLR